MQNLSPLIRLVLSVIAGIFVAAMVIVLTESVQSTLYPAKTKQADIQEIIKNIQSLPIWAFVIGVFGYILSSFLGAYTSARIATPKYKMYSAVTVGFFLLLGGIVQFISIPYPIWYSLTVCAILPLFSVFGGKMAL
jgi:hypothetical protein